jgi:hypothetical protein
MAIQTEKQTLTQKIPFFPQGLSNFSGAFFLIWNRRIHQG